MGEAHWEKVYLSKAADAVSWYRPHLELSLNLIVHVAGGSSAAILDIGGGASTLVDDLLDRGYQNLTVLDISPAALTAVSIAIHPSKPLAVCVPRSVKPSLPFWPTV